MTRKEKADVVDGCSDRYNHLGALLVGDDHSLCGLLTTLQIGAKDHEIGDYLTSFLTVCHYPMRRRRGSGGTRAAPRQFADFIRSSAGRPGLLPPHVPRAHGPPAVERARGVPRADVPSGSIRAACRR